MEKFKALMVDKDGEKVVSFIKDIGIDDLSDGDVVIKVAYSSVNYKDALAALAGGGVVRDYPMIPGIDLSGTVVSSLTDKFKVGQEVLATGFNIGTSHTGGYSEYVRLPHEWLVSLPSGLSLRDAMIVGTAGFTSGLSVMALEKMGMSPESSPNILITGASGGVGSIATLLLAKSGYKNITALSRKKDEIDTLKKLGAKEVLTPDDLIPETLKPLAAQKYHFILDTVGGKIASGLIPQIYYGGSMSMCGHAAGIEISTTALPFILRGISILGIDSVQVPIEKRPAIWQNFTDKWNFMSDAVVTEIGLEELPLIFSEIQAGTHVGRTIVKIG